MGEACWEDEDGGGWDGDDLRGCLKAIVVAGSFAVAIGAVAVLLIVLMLR
jgi:hypothetical protein